MTFAEDMTEFADAARRFARAMERFEGARLRHMAAQMDAASAAIEAALGGPVEVEKALVGEMLEESSERLHSGVAVQAPGLPDGALEQSFQAAMASGSAPSGFAVGDHGEPLPLPAEPEAAALAHAASGWDSPEVAYVSPTAPGEPAELSQTPPWERPAEPTSEPAKEGGRRTNEQIAAEHGVRLDAVKAWKAANSIGTNRVKAEEIKAYAIAVRQGAVPGAGPLASQPPAPVAAPQEQSIDDFAVDLDAAPVDGGTPPQTWQPPF